MSLKIKYVRKSGQILGSVTSGYSDDSATARDRGRRILVSGAQNVEGETLGAFSPHARQFLQLFNEPDQRLDIAAHDALLLTVGHYRPCRTYSVSKKR